MTLAHTPPETITALEHPRSGVYHLAGDGYDWSQHATGELAGSLTGRAALPMGCDRPLRQAIVHHNIPPGMLTCKKCTGKVTGETACMRSPGAPSSYNRELAFEICSRVAEGRSLKSVCSDKDIGISTYSFWSWLRDSPDAKCDKLPHRWEMSVACQEHNLAFESLEIADSTRVSGDNAGLVQAKDKMRIQARQWFTDQRRRQANAGVTVNNTLRTEGDTTVEVAQVDWSKLPLELRLQVFEALGGEHQGRG